MNAVDYRIQVYKNGRDAVGRIDKQATKNWYDWLTVGRRMVEARTEAFETVGTNKAIGAAYNQAFGDILRREKLHENVLDKGTRSLLLNIMDNELKNRSVARDAEQRAAAKMEPSVEHLSQLETLDRATKGTKAGARAVIHRGRSRRAEPQRQG